MSIFDKVKNFIDNSDEDTIDENIEIPRSLSEISAQPQDRLLRLRCPI